MEIRINDHTVDFSIEGEETLQDVVEGIAAWCAERGLVFSRLFVDDAAYELDSIPTTSLESIDSINCIVESQADVIYSVLEQGISYCHRAFAYLEESEESDLVDERDDILNGLSWLAEVLEKVLTLLGEEPGAIPWRDGSVETFIERITSFRQELSSADDKERVLSHIAGLGELYRDYGELSRMLMMSEPMRRIVTRSIDSPDVLMENLQQVKEESTGVVTTVQEAAVAFQSGNDQEGAEKLNIFIDYVFRYTRTLYQAQPVFSLDLLSLEIEGVALEEQNRDLQELLSDALEAMESDDIVGLADILEYEIQPALENLPRYLELVIEEITAS